MEQPYTFLGYPCVIIDLESVYITVRNCKIKMKNLNNSGQAYTLLTLVLVIAIGLTISTVIIFLIKGQ